MTTKTFNFPWIGTLELRQQIRMGKVVEASLRQKLPKGIYWTKLERKIMWNHRLVADLVMFGDRPDHRKLVERFLQSIEQSA